MVCAVCSSYSAHLYENLEGGILDGLTMKNDFCQSLVSACQSFITFPTYDGDDYCTYHTGGGDDFFWSYPYVERESLGPPQRNYVQIPKYFCCMEVS